jgi:UDP-glucose 4-epimerase
MKSWVFRLANIVGKRQTHGVIFDFINKLKKNPKELEILGDGLQSKSYLHVSDCIDAAFFCLENSNKKVNAFNVAPLDYTTVNEIADIVVKEMKLKDVRFKYTGGSRGWKGDVPVVRLNTDRINTLGWKPKLSSLEAVQRAVKENLNPCK